MRLQDSINLLTTNLKNYSNHLENILLPLIVALIIFILGIFIASLISRLWKEVAKLLNFEKTLLSFDNYKALLKFDKNVSFTEIVSLIIWWSIVLTFSASSLEIMGIKVSSVLNIYFAFLPTFIVSAFILFVGSLVAYFTYLVINGVGILINFPFSLWVGRFISFAIITTTLILTLKSLGISEEMLRFIEIATIAAGSLAAGLAGRELTSSLVKQFRNLVK